MPITVEDLLAPNGPVERVFHEDEDVPAVPVDPEYPAETAFERRLRRYIDRAYLKAEGDSIPAERVDEAATAWALYLTFDALFMIKNNAPATEKTLLEDSFGFNVKQIQAFKVKADDYQEMYATIQATTPFGGVGAPPSTWSGGSFPIIFEY